MCYLTYCSGASLVALCPGDTNSTPDLGRSFGERNGSPPQYSGLENPRDRGAWWAIVHGITKSQTQLSDWTVTTTTCYLKTRCCILMDTSIYFLKFSAQFQESGCCLNLYNSLNSLCHDCTDFGHFSPKG